MRWIPRCDFQVDFRRRFDVQTTRLLGNRRFTIVGSPCLWQPINEGWALPALRLQISNRQVQEEES